MSAHPSAREIGIALLTANVHGGPDAVDAALELLGPLSIGEQATGYAIALNAASTLLRNAVSVGGFGSVDEAIQQMATFLATEGEGS